MVNSRIMADEQEITSDERAVAEPEIEPVEGLEREPEMEPDESAAAEGDRAEAGCSVRMGDFGHVSCPRRLHVAPDGIDEKPVCLMHSKDPRKQSGPLFDACSLEFERILGDAGEGEAYFDHFFFPPLDFTGRKFEAICRFYAATFTQDADFSYVPFAKEADFREATFTQHADFRFAIFTQTANFHKATFMQDADFSGRIFTQWADFGEVTFEQAIRFVGTIFHGTAHWESSRFLDQAEFRRTKFDPQIAGAPSAVFALARFSKPGEIVFDDVDLSRALFHDTDVSQLWFTSSVRWGNRYDIRGLAVFEETIDFGQRYAIGLKRSGQRDYGAVAQIYHQLKKNYDSRLDYWTANECHFGEMEMRRLATPVRGRLFRGEWKRPHRRRVKLLRKAGLWRVQVRKRSMRLRWWLHRRLSLVALYLYASGYGNSYGKPMLWLLATVVLFALLLPLPGVGLTRQEATHAETYASAWRAGDDWRPNLWAEARLVGKGAITAVDAATFQKSAEYAPAYPWGRVLAIFETLLTSSLLALFLLAIRRQFRR